MKQYSYINNEDMIVYEFIISSWHCNRLRLEIVISIYSLNMIFINYLLIISILYFIFIFNGYKNYLFKVVHTFYGAIYLL